MLINRILIAGLGSIGKRHTRSVQQKTSPFISGEDGLRTVFIIEALNSSSNNDDIVFL